MSFCVRSQKDGKFDTEMIISFSCHYDQLKTQPKGGKIYDDSHILSMLFAVASVIV